MATYYYEVDAATGRFVSVPGPTPEERERARHEAARLPTVLRVGECVWLEAYEAITGGTALKRIHGADIGAPWLGSGWQFKLDRRKRTRCVWDKDARYSRGTDGRVVVCVYDGNPIY